MGREETADRVRPQRQMPVPAIAGHSPGQPEGSIQTEPGAQHHEPREINQRNHEDVTNPQFCWNCDGLRPGGQCGFSAAQTDHQEQQPHPEINPVGAVKQKQGERDDGHQGRYQRRHRPKRVFAHQVQPAKLILCRHCVRGSHLRSKVKSAGVGSSQQACRRHPHAKGNHPRCILFPSLLGQRKDHRLNVVKSRPFPVELSKAPQQGPVQEDLVGIIEICRSCQGKLFPGLCIYPHPDAIPCIAYVAWMTPLFPARPRSRTILEKGLRVPWASGPPSPTSNRQIPALPKVAGWSPD